MAIIKESKEEKFKRYVIRPLSDIVIGGMHTYYDLGLAESEAKDRAKETGVYYEVIEEEVHSRHLKSFDYNGKEILEDKE